MIEGWLRHLKLTAKSKGAIPSLAVWAIAASIAGLAALAFFSVAAFIWLSRQYDDLTAALILAGVYAVLAIAFVIVLLVVRRVTMQRARRELEARSTAMWQDPRVLAIGVQIGRMLGWKKTLPLAAIGLLAAGVAREWSSHDSAQDEN